MPIPTQNPEHPKVRCFLFRNSDQAFMSKCIAEESNLTTAKIHQRIKNLESSNPTAKHTTGSTAPATINQLHGK